MKKKVEGEEAREVEVPPITCFTSIYGWEKKFFIPAIFPARNCFRSARVSSIKRLVEGTEIARGVLYLDQKSGEEKEWNDGN